MTLVVTEEQILAPDRTQIRIRVYRQADHTTRPRPGIVFFPGGGFVTPGLHSHDGFVRRLATTTGHVVVSVAYRLAPRHRFPAAVHDACDATAYVAGHAEGFGIDPGHLAVAGTSAGGNLAAVLAQQSRHREHHGPDLRHQILIVPLTDPAAHTPSRAEFAHGYGLDRDTLQQQARQYLTPADRDDIRAAPLRAGDLTGLPPATVVTGGSDPLRDEGEQYAARMAAAGVDVLQQRLPNTPHLYYLDPTTHTPHIDQTLTLVANRIGKP